MDGQITAWVLIFYLSGYKQGGPGVAEFYSETACKHAIYLLHKSIERKYTKDWLGLSRGEAPIESGKVSVAFCAPKGTP